MAAAPAVTLSTGHPQSGGIRQREPKPESARFRHLSDCLTAPSGVQVFGRSTLIPEAGPARAVTVSLCFGLHQFFYRQRTGECVPVGRSDIEPGRTPLKCGDFDAPRGVIQCWRGHPAARRHPRRLHDPGFGPATRQTSTRPQMPPSPYEDISKSLPADLGTDARGGLPRRPRHRARPSSALVLHQ